MQRYFSPAHTFCHAFPLPATFTTPAHRQSFWSHAPRNTLDNIDRFVEHCKLTHSFNNICMSSKDMHVSHRLSLLSLLPLYRMPLCVGRHTHGIRNTSIFLSFPSHFWLLSRSRIGKEPTTQTLRQSLTTHYSPQYLSMARSIPVLFSTTRPQICWNTFFKCP